MLATVFHLCSLSAHFSRVQLAQSGCDHHGSQLVVTFSVCVPFTLHNLFLIYIFSCNFIYETFKLLGAYCFKLVNNFFGNMSVKECCCLKLSPNKKSIFGFKMRSEILYLLLIASFLTIVSATDTELSCSNVKNVFERKGMLSSVDIQEQPNSGENHALSFHT